MEIKKKYEKLYIIIKKEKCRNFKIKKIIELFYYNLTFETFLQNFTY